MYVLENILLNDCFLTCKLRELQYRADQIINKTLDLVVKGVFQKYLNIYAKDKMQRTIEESIILPAIILFFKEMANLLKRNKEINFDQSQFLFIIPIEWRDKGFECCLRSLFLESNWITKGDHRNRLIFLPFLDCYINYLRNSRLSIWHKEFKREGKYLLYSMMPNTETGGIIFGITCFQMQNAKELSAVSPKLASGDLLLTPTILHSKTIELPSLKDIVKPIIIKNAEKKSNKYKATAKIKKCNIRGIQHKRTCLSISTEIISKKIGCVRDTILFKTNEIAGVYDDEFITKAAEEIASKLLKTYKLIASYLLY